MSGGVWFVLGFLALCVVVASWTGWVEEHDRRGLGARKALRDADEKAGKS